MCEVGGTVGEVRECSPPGLLPFHRGGRDLFLEAPAGFAFYTIDQNMAPWPLLVLRDARKKQELGFLGSVTEGWQGRKRLGMAGAEWTLPVCRRPLLQLVTVTFPGQPQILPLL